MRDFFSVPGATLCAVVGQPIAHSKSPVIHRSFAEQFVLQLQYERLEVAPGALSDALARLRRAGCRGVNVTVPLKEEAAALAVSRTDAVVLAGAANTLWWDEGGCLSATNTDGLGLVNDLTRNLGLELAAKQVLLLGAGGAAAGVIGPLMGAGVRHLYLINRNTARACALAERFAGRGAISCITATETLPHVDIVINATAAGLVGEVPCIPAGVVTGQTFCYDMYYATAPTPFMRRCQEIGATGVSDGLGMLVEQAAAAFRIWHALEPDTASVLASLRG